MLASTDTRCFFSSASTVAPRFARSFLVVLISSRVGTFSNTVVPSARIAAARSGRAAFLAPLISTSPTSLSPPSITILSN